jgi:hypothetical protein
VVEFSGGTSASDMTRRCSVAFLNDGDSTDAPGRFAQSLRLIGSWMAPCRTDEGTLSRLLVEASILLATSRGNPATVLKDAATAYKVDTEAIAAKVKQEFAAKEKAKKTPPPATKTAKKAA